MIIQMRGKGSKEGGENWLNSGFFSKKKKKFQSTRQLIKAQGTTERRSPSARKAGARASAVATRWLWDLPLPVLSRERAAPSDLLPPLRFQSPVPLALYTPHPVFLFPVTLSSPDLCTVVLAA